jgi:hypothetical protein
MESPSATITLSRLTELRIRVSVSEDPELESCVRLSGKRDQETIVEVNGAPMCPGTRYDLHPGSAHTFVCWSSNATLVIEASNDTLRNAYRASSACAQPIAEYHCAINQLRGASNPPRVLVCGRNDACKTDVAVTLVNYAARFGWSPVLIDTDPSPRQCVSIPGAVGCCVVEVPIVLGEDIISHHVSLQYFVGELAAQPHVDVSQVWMNFVRTLCDVSAKFKDEHVLSSGEIIIAPELFGRDGIAALLQIVQLAGITHVLVLHDEYLFEKLISTVAHGVQVDKLSSVSGAMIPASQTASMRLCQRRLLTIFEGSGRGRVNSFGHKFHLSSVSIFRVIATGAKVSAISVDRVDMENVVNCVAAVVDSTQARRDLGGFLASTVCGFARIVSIDGQEINIQTSLAKSALPSGKLTLLVGNVQLIE